MAWSLDSWKDYQIKHIPKYDEALEQTKSTLYKSPPIVNYLEIEKLSSLLYASQQESSFIIQLGDCAELFIDANEANIFSQLGLIDKFASFFPKDINIIKIGRIAGQYAKPRSNEFEIVNNKKVPSYKGDIFHDYSSREVKAKRMIDAYEKSRSTYNIIRKHTQSFFISHEALNLHYEESLTRLCENGQYYNLSAHMLWLGERTRFINSAHVEYLRGISNPVGIKVSHNITHEDLIDIIKALNPNNLMGKIILINRMGEQNIQNHLTDLIVYIKQHNLNVIWMCDPMHGNTITTKENYKTRPVKSILREIKSFADILKNNDVLFQGIHLEASYEEIYECIDDENNTDINSEKYKTLCDPRLNTKQSLEIAEFLASTLALKI